MHTCIHAYMHTYIHTYIHSFNKQPNPENQDTWGKYPRININLCFFDIEDLGCRLAVNSWVGIFLRISFYLPLEVLHVWLLCHICQSPQRRGSVFWLMNIWMISSVTIPEKSEPGLTTSLAPCRPCWFSSIGSKLRLEEPHLNLRVLSRSEPETEKTFTGDIWGCPRERKESKMNTSLASCGPDRELV